MTSPTTTTDDGPWTLGLLAFAVALAPIGCSSYDATEPSAIPRSLTNSIGMDFVGIQPGEFMMGGDDQLARDLGDGPPQRVRITTPFWIGRYEVTQAQYERVMGLNPSRFAAGGDQEERVVGLDTSTLPVDHVTWEEAVEFCRRLSALPEESAAGRRYRLPTDAEWEFACRASGTVREATTLTANIAAASDETPAHNRPVAVGQYRANAWGLYDMQGNVAEWCLDGKRSYDTSTAIDPRGPVALRPVLRGGAWDLPADYARPDRRVEALRGYVFQGFRVVCETSAAP